MGKGYIGYDGKARDIDRGYVGINGKARRIKKGYVGVNGVARQIYFDGGNYSYHRSFYTATPMSRGVSNHASKSIGELAFLAGGKYRIIIDNVSTDTSSEKVECRDIELTRSAATDLSTSRSGLATTRIKEKYVLFAGGTYIGYSGSTLITQDVYNVDVYDAEKTHYIASNVNKTIAGNSGGTRTSNHAIFMQSYYNGQDPPSNIGTVYDDNLTKSNLTLPDDRQYPSLSYIDGKAIVAGGRIASSSQTEYLSSAYCIDDDMVIQGIPSVVASKYNSTITGETKKYAILQEILENNQREITITYSFYDRNLTRSVVTAVTHLYNGHGMFANDWGETVGEKVAVFEYYNRDPDWQYVYLKISVDEDKVISNFPNSDKNTDVAISTCHLGNYMLISGGYSIDPSTPMETSDSILVHEFKYQYQ